MNPEFNEQFEFYIPMEKLKDYTLEIIVMDKDRIGRNECIGKVNQFLQYFKGIHRFFCTLQCLLSQQRNHQLLKIQSVKLPFSGYIGSQRKFIGKATLERYDLKVRHCYTEYFEFHQNPRFFLIVENNLFQPESSVKPVARSQIVNFNSVLFCIFYLCIFEISSN